MKFIKNSIFTLIVSLLASPQLYAQNEEMGLSIAENIVSYCQNEVYAKKLHASLATLKICAYCDKRLNSSYDETEFLSTPTNKRNELMAVHLETLVHRLDYSINKNEDAVINFTFNDSSKISLIIPNQDFGRRQRWDLEQIIGNEGFIVGKQRSTDGSLSNAARNLHLFTSGTLGKTPIVILEATPAKGEH